MHCHHSVSFHFTAFIYGLPTATVLPSPLRWHEVIASSTAVDACPAGGSVLLLPGTHDGPLVLTAGKVVHVFGRGLAAMWTATGAVVTSDAVTSTLDGLIIRREAGGTNNHGRDCVWIKGGRLRMQACDVTSTHPQAHCIWIERADPVLVACKCVRAGALALFWPHVFGGEGGGRWGTAAPQLFLSGGIYLVSGIGGALSGGVCGGTISWGTTLGHLGHRRESTLTAPCRRYLPRHSNLT